MYLLVTKHDPIIFHSSEMYYVCRNKCYFTSRRVIPFVIYTFATYYDINHIAHTLYNLSSFNTVNDYRNGYKFTI